MIGRVIDDDMFGVCRRLKSVDDGYFVFLNYKTGKFEVHNSRSRPNTLCLVLPFETLDERTVNRVLYTRAERAREIMERIERENAARERERKSRAMNAILSSVAG